MQGEQLQTSTLGLVHTITRHDMNPGSPTIKIKCVASIYTAYYKTVEIIVGRKMRRRKSKRRQEGTPQPPEVNQRGNLNSERKKLSCLLDDFPQVILIILSPSTLVRPACLAVDR